MGATMDAVKNGMAQSTPGPAATLVPEDEKKAVADWRKRLEHARKHDERFRARWADDRRIARNEPKDSEPEWLVDTDLIGAIMEVLLAFLYAKDPDVNARPSPSAGRERKKVLIAFAETIQTVVSMLMRRANLKRRAKPWIRAAMTVGIGWLKAIFQTRTERDPIAENRLNDLRDNAGRAAAIQALIDRGEAPDEQLARQRIAEEETALQGQLERQVADGLALDVIAADDLIVSPECGSVENYDNAPWIAHDIYAPATEAATMLGWADDRVVDLQRATKYSSRKRDDHEGGSVSWVAVSAGDGEAVDGFVRITEVWSKRHGLVYTLLDGFEGYARPAYAPRTGARFYPFFEIAFHWIDGERYPKSDVRLLKKLQEEYARTRSNMAEHRRRAIPKSIFNSTELDAEDAKAITKAVTGEMIPVKPAGMNVDLRTLVVPIQYPPIDPGLYSTDPIRLDMEKVSGAQDAMQSGIAVEKTATEAKIQDSGFGARIGARRECVESSLTELAIYVAQIALQIMDQADAVRWAGPGAVWTQLSVEEALTLFDVEIKAGSTGKPKANSDREAWGTLLPMIQGMIGTIGAAREAGKEWAAQPLIALLEETFKRLDDPADVERFLPIPPPPQPMIDPVTGQPVIDPATGQPMLAPAGMPAAAAAPAGAAPPPPAPI